MAREQFQRELKDLREALLRMAGQVETQIESALTAMRTLDGEAAEEVQRVDRAVNDAYRELHERCMEAIATQQPVAGDLRAIVGVQRIALELERMGDYAVRLARRTCILAGLPRQPLRPEFGLMGELAVQQVRDILDALIDQDTSRAVEVARRDDEIDQLYHRVFDHLVQERKADDGPDQILRAVTLIQAAHDLERIGDRVTNVAEDILFLDLGRVVELG